MSAPPRRRDWEDLRLLRVLGTFARPDLRLYLLALAATPGAAILTLAQPWLVGQIIDRHIVPGELGGMSTLTSLFLAAVMGSIALDLGSTLALAFAGQRTIRRLRTSLFERALRLGQRFHDREPTGSLLTRLTSDVEALGETLTSRVVTIGLDILIMLGALAAMFLANWRLTLILLVAAPPMLLVVEISRRQLRKLYQRVRSALSAANSFLADRVAGREVLQLFQAERGTLEEYEDLNRRHRDAAVYSNFWDALMYSVVDGAGAIGIGILLGFAVSDLGAGISVGLVVAFVQYLDRLFHPLREISGKITIIQRAIAALERIAELLDSPLVPSEGEISLPNPRGAVSFKGVGFRYDEGGPMVLNGVDLHIAPGQVVALVGPTGGGKTTIGRLLNRTYDGYTGSITIDGEEVSKIRLSELRRGVAVVQQDVHLFPETVRFNVDLDDPSVSLGQVLEAARATHMDMFVDSLPSGWGHVLKDRSEGLSAGQGQLLTFARTLVRDAPVVVLDEATASVDSVTEALVQQALERVLHDRTVLVIAHRLSTIAAADKIAVVDGGRILEAGTHGELMALGGRYARLHAHGQAGGTTTIRQLTS